MVAAAGFDMDDLTSPGWKMRTNHFRPISGVYAALCHCTALTILIAIVLKVLKAESLAKAFGSCLSFSTLRISRSATVAETTESFTGSSPGKKTGLNRSMFSSINGNLKTPVGRTTGCHWFTEAALFAEAVTYDCSLRSGMNRNDGPQLSCHGQCNDADGWFMMVYDGLCAWMITIYHNNHCSFELRM